MHKVFGIPFKSYDEALSHLLANHKALVESYYPLFIGNQMNNEKWHLKTNMHNYHTMKADHLDVLSYEFEHIDSFC